MLSTVSAYVAPLWLLAPFVLLLLGIALGPMLFPHMWHRRYPLVAASLGAISVGWYLGVARVPQPMLHAAEEYIGFIALIGSLFVVAGGIHIRVKGEATPAANALFLLIGAVLANVIGTTGASMLLVRPWIRMNKIRISAFHIVFFIFIVSNVGGCLTPIGDPPLFLGYLKGVPFWWVAENCWQGWMVAVLALIAIFFVFDWRSFRQTPREIQAEAGRGEWWQFHGLHNLGFIGLILFAVLRLPMWWREGAMLVAALASWFTTKRDIHLANHFNLEPLREVAWLFIGIFATMVPALSYLQAHGTELGLATDMHFYWATGVLSGVLDNAPTYLAFLAAAMGQYGVNIESSTAVAAFAQAQPGIMQGISLGAVFFGAMTYIGNGPNFMVKAISEHAGVKTPSFVRYVTHFAVPLLLPVFFMVGILFFSRWRITG
jgi:Na+/H+ antiporter NhaD/arsenite permease-like protein